MSSPENIELLPVHTSDSYNTSLDEAHNTLVQAPQLRPPQAPRALVYETKASGSLLDVDKPAFYLLVLLYFLQGIPVGLAFGSIPFLMKSSHLSYSQLGTFSLASYPYSLKLLWSPFVDLFYLRKIGRRRLWIIPVQTVTGIIFILLGLRIDLYFSDLSNNLYTLTIFFFLLVLMALTQDIAVDSWALVILSPASKSYASTAQTVGLNTGYFLLFTVFLAFNLKEFMNKYFRSPENQKDMGLITLGQYMVLSGFIFLICTAYVALRVLEVPEHLRMSKRVEDAVLDDSLDEYFELLSSNGWENLKRTYSKMFRVLSLRTVQQFIFILLVCKFGFMINESATNLKLLDKGFSKEDLSLTVLIDFPFEIFFGYYVAKWSRGTQALNPWLYAYAGRLVAALLGQLVVYIFPLRKNPETGIQETVVTTWYFLAVIIQHLFSSLMSTFQFVSLSAFHTRIADPAIGGTYMTTLNTISNFGGTWPKFFLLKLIDRSTYAICAPESLSGLLNVEIVPFEKFWSNVTNFVRGATGAFKSVPKSEELSLFSSFDLGRLNLQRFFDYVNAHFGLKRKILSWADLTAAKSISLANYITDSKKDKVVFWEQSGQIGSLPSCSLDPKKQVCLNYFGGECLVIRDGYYAMNMICVTLGGLLLVFYIWRKVNQLQALDENSWRVR